jgi:NAD-dependent deacetylase sirtuin 5
LTAHCELDIQDESVPIPRLGHKDLPQCPACKKDLLRPGVVWFGEALPKVVIEDVDTFLEQPEKVDLIMVIGGYSSILLRV